MDKKYQFENMEQMWAAIEEAPTALDMIDIFFSAEVEVQRDETQV